MGRIVAWDELSLFGIWDELSLGTNCRLGRIVAWDELSLYGRHVAQKSYVRGGNVIRLIRQEIYRNYKLK